jgi:hypothetical protein
MVVLAALGGLQCSRSASSPPATAPRPPVAVAAPAAPKPPAEARAMTTPEILQQLAQRTLDLPKLEAYYHLDERPERSPLVVVGESVAEAAPKLKKFGKPVIWKRDADVRPGQPVFRFTQVVVQGDGATVEFEYPPEGLRGSAKFKRTGEEWQATDVSIRER